MPAKTAQNDRASLAAAPVGDGLSVGPGERPGQGARQAGDDFYCLRFGLWYRSYDCAIRTRFETCPACLKCDQGRFNLRRHRSAIGHRSLLHACRG